MIDIRRFIRLPGADDDKYSHGVVGLVTGSTQYPGAAILSVSAAIRAGAGLVRYLGPQSVAELLLEVRPEVVLGDGRADVWVLGSGVPAQPNAQIEEHLGAAQITVVDAGALEIVDYSLAPARTVLTPHAGELARLLKRFGQAVSREAVEAKPEFYASTAAKLTNCVVLLKGHLNYIATASGEVLVIGPLSAVLATAGSGDVLAGLLGAVLAQNQSQIIDSEAMFLSAIEFAVQLHSAAAEEAAKEGPVAAMDIVLSMRKLIASANE